MLCNFCSESLPTLLSLQTHLQQDHSIIFCLYLFVKVGGEALSDITFAGNLWSETPNLEDISSNLSSPIQDFAGSTSNGTRAVFSSKDDSSTATFVHSIQKQRKF
jgi:hypothetical protein